MVIYVSDADFRVGVPGSSDFTAAMALKLGDGALGPTMLTAVTLKL